METMAPELMVSIAPDWIVMDFATAPIMLISGLFDVTGINAVSAEVGTPPVQLAAFDQSVSTDPVHKDCPMISSVDNNSTIKNMKSRSVFMLVQFNINKQIILFQGNEAGSGLKKF